MVVIEDVVQQSRGSNMGRTCHKNRMSQKESDDDDDGRIPLIKLSIFPFHCASETQSCK